MQPLLLGKDAKITVFFFSVAVSKERLFEYAAVWVNEICRLRNYEGWRENCSERVI